MTSRIAGSIVGGVIGDALGMPYEGFTANQIAQMGVEMPPRYVDAPSTNRHTAGLQKGQFTDDSQLTLATMDSILTQGRIDVYDLARRMVDEANAGLRGGGRSTKLALKEAARHFRAGRFPDDTGLEDAYGCGAAMRIAPVALLGIRGQQLDTAVVDTSAITHRNGVAYASAHVVAGIIQHLAFDPTAEGTIDQDQAKRILEEAIVWSKWEQPPEHSVTGSLEAVLSMFGKPYRHVASEIGNSGHAKHSVPLAVYAFLTSPNDFEKMAYEIILGGGDTDSIASMAGQMWGAHNGLENIPLGYKLGFEKTKEITEKALQFERLVTQS